ncbi:MAG TPA: hypothetical protein VLO07_03200 [Thermoanaerobaculia bacterium]|nr:hypothetical protein [Thermoanaerobaculia bacterium]
MAESPGMPNALRVLAIEIIAYAILVTLYLVAVLRALRPWLAALAARHDASYALCCLLLMLGQGVILESLTTWLLRRFARARRRENVQEKAL